MEDYNNIPVYYCKNCLSLRIKSTFDQRSFCDECGSTDIGSMSILDWEKLYEERYNHKYLKDNGRDKKCR